MPLTVGVLKETLQGETRVALTPEITAKLQKLGVNVTMETGAGAAVGILDGDYAIIQESDTAENGSIVVALIDDEEATLKRLRRRGNSVALEAANKDYETRIFPPDRVKIQGRLVSLIRRY